VGQFVPLKVVSKGDQWQKWATKFKREGSGIPIIYVVRSDGEQLYGKSGALSGDALPQMLTAVSQQSGRVFGESEAMLLEECNAAAEAALDEEQYMKAAEALKPVSKVGRLGGLQSYAAPAIKSDELAKRVLEHSMSALKEVEEKLADSETLFEGIVELSSISQGYGMFEEAKKASNLLLKKVSRDKAARELLKPAKALVKARRDTQLPKASDKKRAEKGYGSILKRYGDTPAGPIARAELTNINPDSEFLTGQLASTEPAGDEVDRGSKSGYGQEEIRTWSNASGEFSVEAKLIEATDEFVRLEKASGKVIKVPLKKLDSAAKKYLGSRQ